MLALRASGRLSVVLSGLIAIILGVCATDAFGAIRYVNGGLATGANTGTSWADAYRGPNALNMALTASVAGDEIWVAAGTYKPSSGSVRTISFTLKTGVAIYGGFTGNETSRKQRDWVANVTILSGDLGGNDGSGIFTDNSYHVLVGSGAQATAILDGFTVRGGNANGASAGNQDKGGGLLIVSAANPTIRNCIFTQNRCTFGGGAGYISPGGATFTDCQFINNVGGSFGGAFDTNGATTKFERCLFSGNTAARAGAVESFGGANMTLTNCVFTGNTATGSNGGGAIWASATVQARNCTFTGNSATSLAGCVRTTAGAVGTFGNCILWGNTGPGGMTVANQISNGGGSVAVSYSVVQGGYTGTANLNADPKFVNAAGGDLRLQEASPCIDSGSNSLVPVGTVTDYAGLPRFADAPAVVDSGSGIAPIVDRGAHEVQPPPAPVCPADLNEDGTVNGADLGLLLAAWGSCAGCAADLNNDGMVNGADLGLLLAAWGACAE